MTGKLEISIDHGEIWQRIPIIILQVIEETEFANLESLRPVSLSYLHQNVTIPIPLLCIKKVYMKVTEQTTMLIMTRLAPCQYSI
jgi:hypothetical protein